MFTDVALAVLSGASVFLGLAMIKYGLALAKGDHNEYDRNRNRAHSITAVVRGEVSTKFDGLRDDKVAAGIAIDKRTNEWKEQGRLSDEALRDTLSV